MARTEAQLRQERFFRLMNKIMINFFAGKIQDLEQLEEFAVAGKIKKSVNLSADRIGFG